MKKVFLSVMLGLSMTICIANANELEKFKTNIAKFIGTDTNNVIVLYNGTDNKIKARLKDNEQKLKECCDPLVVSVFEKIVNDLRVANPDLETIIFDYSDYAFLDSKSIVFSKYYYKQDQISKQTKLKPNTKLNKGVMYIPATTMTDNRIKGFYITNILMRPKFFKIKNGETIDVIECNWLSFNIVSADRDMTQEEKSITQEIENTNTQNLKMWLDEYTKAIKEKS